MDLVELLTPKGHTVVLTDVRGMGRQQATALYDAA
jgi:hypothetical protein